MDSSLIMITLQAITIQNLRPIVRLSLKDDEKGLVFPNVFSIAEAYVEPNTTPLGIYADDTPVGFLFYGQFEEDKGEYWIARLMIDKNHRRKGYAETAMRVLLDELQQKEDCKEVFLSFVPTNTAAQALYEKLGFEDTGKIVDKEKLYVYKF